MSNRSKTAFIRPSDGFGGMAGRRQADSLPNFLGEISQMGGPRFATAGLETFPTVDGRAARLESVRQPQRRARDRPCGLREWQAASLRDRHNEPPLTPGRLRRLHDAGTDWGRTAGGVIRGGTGVRCLGAMLGAAIFAPRSQRRCGMVDGR